MGEIIFITGGQRSGKSSYAQSLAEGFSQSPLYLATARRWDADFEQRIERHRRDRGNQWRTIEEPKELSRLSLSGETVLLDCVTLWLTNIYHDSGYRLQESLDYARQEWESFINQDFRLIVVSNEIGMAMHAPQMSARHFADLQGWVNQFIAARSTIAYLMISGIPVKIK